MAKKKTRNKDLNIRIPAQVFKMKQEKNVCGDWGAIYGLGFLGALFYYLTTATSLTAALFGVLKALLWPAFLVFQLMTFLGM